MATVTSGKTHVTRSERKLARQKRDRRKKCLMKKAHEYSKMCNADICVGIRIRESGHVFIFSADASNFWSFVGSQLGSYYPTPFHKTERDL
ncbi:hypothetical protein N7492_009705 [Penicillium capsulatum]|uniref:MADS-box domain-containing protein n=1 Tax=Penicillium capsulatum TaxID=69766 RepID=A0A9W9HPQ0_9EURO|nr:hypothetical protein N7492_009705 [Penicillium capsulatum]KAJ6114214.1 hypothetical protein N7512_007659 [Penicillium capsulatum]